MSNKTGGEGAANEEEGGNGKVAAKGVGAAPEGGRKLSKMPQLRMAQVRRIPFMEDFDDVMDWVQGVDEGARGNV